MIRDLEPKKRHPCLSTGLVKPVERFFSSPGILFLCPGPSVYFPLPYREKQKVKPQV